MRVALSDLLETPIPERLSRRPRDARGFPIPATVLIKDDGTPDFRVTDLEKWVRVVRAKCCALCAEPLGRHLAFIGGPLTHENRLFTDPPMHRECASYAMAVCPYLALTSTRHARKIPEVAGVTMRVSSAVSPDRPEKMFIGITRSYEPMKLGDGTLVLRAAPWESVEWHKGRAQGSPGPLVAEFSPVVPTDELG